MISFIVPTIGRLSLKRTLASIETRLGDEILVVGATRPDVDDPRVRFLACPAGNDWGSSERNFAMPQARGRFLAFLDDDDKFMPGARAVMADAIMTSLGRPTIFRMRHQSSIVLWREREIACGNVGTPMIFVPNVPSRLGVWGREYGGDFAFANSCKWGASDWVWREEMTAWVGPDA